MTIAVLFTLLALAQAPSKEVLGSPVPDLPRLRWVQGGPLQLADLRGKVVLIRFFMDARCPLCSGTAPALNEFDRDFRSKGLVVIGMYTPKPRPRTTSVKEVRGYAKAFGFLFPVAVDDEWGALRRLWLDRVPNSEYTSVSLLIDRDGVLRHVQLGGLYAKNAKDPQSRRDYEAMRAQIVTLVAQPGR